MQNAFGGVVYSLRSLANACWELQNVSLAGVGVRTWPEKCRNPRPRNGETLLDSANIAVSFWQSFPEHCYLQGKGEIKYSLKPKGQLNHAYLQNAVRTQELLLDLELM